MTPTKRDDGRMVTLGDPAVEPEWPDAENLPQFDPVALEAALASFYDSMPPPPPEKERARMRRLTRKLVRELDQNHARR